MLALCCFSSCHWFADSTDHSKYEGEFKDGKYHGTGTFQRGDGMKYEGSFVGGQARGMGLLTFADGTNGRPRQEGSCVGIAQSVSQPHR
jgi:hypothetical protein